MYSVWRNGLCCDASKQNAYRAELIVTINPTKTMKRYTVKKVRKCFKTAEQARQWAKDEQQALQARYAKLANKDLTR